ncbi:MAG: hypothetical protein H0T46_14035 [Deltaproteobacteria bacterium]|nr:hypothetical protein [Deltaproteobacteria bacterium]
MTTRFKPITNNPDKTAKKRPKRKPTMPSNASTAMKRSAATKSNDNTLDGALSRLFPDFAKSLLPPVAIVDEIDALRFSADICSVAAFIAERAANERTGKPEPAFPTLTSELGRNLAAALHDWMTTFAANLTPDARANLGSLSRTLESAFKGKDGQLLDFMRQTITSDARATAEAVNFFVYITTWNPR